MHPGLLDPREIERARKVPGITLVKDAAPAVGPLVWLAFNTKSPKLADKRVRQAIHCAFDKKTLIDSLLGVSVRRRHHD